MVDIGCYHQKPGELLEDLESYKPDILMLGWCDSLNSDIANLLREVFNIKL